MSSANKKYKNTYRKLNQDVSKSKYNSELYYDALNMRLLAHTEQSSGSTANVRGDLWLRNLPNVQMIASNIDGSYTYSYDATGNDGIQTVKTYITNFDFAWAPNLTQGPILAIGWAAILDKIVLFACKENDVNQMGYIWELTPATNELQLMYMHKLNFSIDHPIIEEAVGIYENEFSRKVYWTDAHNELRHINLADADLPNLPIDFTTILPNSNFSDITLERTTYGSGSFTAGSVAYAYSYANDYGVQSKVSPLSKQFVIANPYSGEEVTTPVPVSFEMKIRDLSPNFTYLRVYRLYYSTPVADPIVTLIKDEAISSNDFVFTDDGYEEISAFSLVELLLLGSDPFVPYSIGTKDNMLLTANNRVLLFDPVFDARAYRFDSSGDCTIMDEQGNTTVVTSDHAAIPTSWFNVPEKHDCINPSVRAETAINGSTAAQAALEVDSLYDPYYNQFVFQADGVTTGAEGPYIKLSAGIGATTAPFQAKAGENPAMRYPESGNGDSFLNPANTIKIGFKRDEVYRIGIIFYNGRGQASFVKWICDFRMPPVPEFPLFNNTTKEFYQLRLTVQLKANAIALLEEQGVTHYQVVRVNRDVANRSIQAQGMIGNLIWDTIDGLTNDTQCPPYMAMYGVDAWGLNYVNAEYQRARAWLSVTTNGVAVNEHDTGDVYYRGDYVEFRSSDLNLSVSPSGYFIVHTAAKISSLYSLTQSEALGNPLGHNGPAWAVNDGNGDVNYRAETVFFSENLRSNGQVRIQPWLDSNTLLFDRSEVTTGIIDDGTNPSITINSAHSLRWGPGSDYHCNTNHWLCAKIGDKDATPNAVDLAAQLDDIVYTHGESDDVSFLLADYKRRLYNQYGGPTYADRSRNKYIAASGISLLADETTATGDTYVTNMRYQRNEAAYPELFPGDGSSKKAYVRDVYIIPAELTINEDLRQSQYILGSTGSFYGTKNRYSITISQFHTYNPIYHYQDIFSVNRTSIPLGFNVSTYFPNETRYSEVKTFGEQFDSWAKFKAGNARSVDGKFGPIEKIIVNNDTLYYFQYYAFGAWNMNPNVQVVGEDGTSIELGTGSVLHEYKYISTNSGSKHKFSFSKSPFGLIWWDQINRKLRMVMGEGSMEANMIGINTWLQNTPDYGNNPLTGSAVIGGYYQRTNETYISFIHPSGTTTWIFSNVENAFVGKISINPKMYIQGNENFLLVTSTDRITMFDKGAIGVFDQVLYPSYITVVINGDPDVVKNLMNLQWNSEVLNAFKEHEGLQTITHIRAWNEHRDTGLIELTQANHRRLAGMWAYAIPRIDTIGRLTGQYFYVQLYFDNLSGNDLILHDVISDVVLQFPI